MRRCRAVSIGLVLFVDMYLFKLYESRMGLCSASDTGRGIVDS
jgi:hypothetical protein